LALVPLLGSSALANVVSIITPTMNVAASDTNTTSWGATPPADLTSALSTFTGMTATQTGGARFNLVASTPFPSFYNDIQTTASSGLSAQSTMQWTGTIYIPQAPGQAVGANVNCTITGALTGGSEFGSGGGSGEVVGTFNLNDGVNNQTATVTPFGPGPSLGGGGAYTNQTSTITVPLQVGVNIPVTLTFNANTIIDTPVPAEGTASISGFSLNVTPANAPAAGNSTIAFIESGYAWDQHNDLTGTVQAQTQIGTATTYTDHGTETLSRFFTPVAGLGINGGVANRATWNEWGVATGAATANVANAVNLVAGAVKIINISRGVAGASNGSDAASMAIDSAAYNQRVLTTVAINEGTPRPNVSDPESSFNCLAVGATNQATETPPDANFFRGVAAGSVIAPYSGTGLTADGRSKPDIVAPGTNCTMAAYNDPVAGAGGNANFTAVASGTSFAAPYVAGVASQLIDNGTSRNVTTDPLVIKAVLMNSAQQVGAWNGWSPTNQTVPLDPLQGAGEVSLPRSMIQYQGNPQLPNGNVVNPIGWDMNTVAPTKRNFYVLGNLAAGATLNATLDWFREMTAGGAVVGGGTGLDDLDLELWSLNAANVPQTIVTQCDSFVDDVEDLHRFSIPTSGNYAIAVDFFKDNTNNGSDSYGLAYYVPEPSSLMLISIGALGMLRRRGR